MIIDLTALAEKMTQSLDRETVLDSLYRNDHSMWRNHPQGEQ